MKPLGEQVQNKTLFTRDVSPVVKKKFEKKLNPTTQVVFDNAVIVDHTGDEKTAVRFTLDDTGNVVDVNSRPKSLIENFRDWHRNGTDLDPKTHYLKKL